MFKSSLQNIQIYQTKNPSVTELVEVTEGIFVVPARIELASKEPESFILSIKLWDRFDLFYKVLFSSLLVLEFLIYAK